MAALTFATNVRATIGGLPSHAPISHSSASTAIASYDLVLTFDNTKVTSVSALRKIVHDLLLLAEGSGLAK